MKLGKLLADAGVVSKEHFEKTQEAERAIKTARKEAETAIKRKSHGVNTPYRDLNLRQLLPTFVGWRNRLPKKVSLICCSCGKRGVVAREFKNKMLAHGITSLLLSKTLPEESLTTLSSWINGELAQLPAALEERAMMLSGFTTDDSPHPNKLLEPLGSYLQLLEFQKLLEFVPRHMHPKLRELNVCRECIAKHDPRFADMHRRMCAGFELMSDPARAKEHLLQFLKGGLADTGDDA